ncbi:MAG TPA: transposase family protein [Thermoanaerobaculia bacterium]|nr:transposase family protein [Thermoanaerobaculia bacterium]
MIDYYSRYLLALHLSAGFDAAALIVGIEQAKAEAERLHGPLLRRPTLVTDNGTSFLSRRFQGKRSRNRTFHKGVGFASLICQEVGHGREEAEREAA